MSRFGRIGVVSQARMTSTRLPGKVLERAGDRSMLEHHLDRLDAAGLPVYLATTTNDADDPLVEVAERRGVPVWRGSELDVLDRFAGCVREHDLDVVVRVTSDCPLIDGDLVAAGVERFVAAEDPWRYVSNGIERTFPRGLDFEVFSGAALLDADAHATEPAQREHVTPYLYANGSGRVTLAHVTREPDASRFRITLDTPEDLRLIRILIEDHDAADLDAAGLVALLERHPELVAINAEVEQKKLGQ